MKSLGGLLLALLLAGSLWAQADPRVHAEWWLEQHGALEESRTPEARRIRAIFAEVVAAADKRGGRTPRLVLLRSRRTPLAVSLPDGSVLLNHAALDLLYSPDSHSGDARAAFVLGHELAHLAQDDFWKVDAFFAPSPELNRWLQQESALAPNILKELQADAYGLTYALQAGFPVDALLEEGDRFFERWGGQGRLHPDRDSHPPSTVRAALLQSTLQRVRDAQALFDFGTMLLHLGRLEDARRLLEEYHRLFPGRAVLNNLGVLEFQQAMQDLGRCNPLLPVSIMTPLLVEAETRAELSRGPQRNCLEAEGVAPSLAQARSWLEEATRRDPRHLPSWSNLAAVLLWSQDPAGAMSAADRALELDRTAPEALTLKALALHRFGSAMGLETTDRAIRVLTVLQQRHPDFLPAAYNHAAILSERQRNAAALQAWEQVVRLPLPSPYRNYALGQLGRAPEFPKPMRVPQTSPVRLGSTSSGTPSLKLRLGSFRATFHRQGGVEWLQLGQAVELVMQQRPEIALGNLPRPERVQHHLRREVWQYENFAVEVRGQDVKRAWWFAAPER
jgi:tetratricopeptide (TPR) repeat protein